MPNKIYPLSALKENERRMICFLPKEFRAVALLFFLQLRDLEFERDDVAKNLAVLRGASGRLKARVNAIKAGLEEVNEESLSEISADINEVDRKLDVLDFDGDECCKRIEKNRKLYNLLNQVWEAMFAELARLGKQKLSAEDKKTLRKVWAAARAAAPKELRNFC